MALLGSVGVYRLFLYTALYRLKLQTFLSRTLWHTHQVKRLTFSYIHLPAILTCVYTSPLDQRVIGQVNNQCSHDRISTLKGVPGAVICIILL
jgi:hypothetical protein